MIDKQTKPGEYIPPAFPAPAGIAHITEQGMTLRDYFAAKAMPILLAEKYDDGPAFEAEEVAELAYTYADAMLEARLK